jgi:hypothetical protein
MSNSGIAKIEFRAFGRQAIQLGAAFPTAAAIFPWQRIPENNTALAVRNVEEEATNENAPGSRGG